MKFKKSLSLLLLSGVIISSVPTIPVHAQTGSSYGQQNTYFKVQPISVYFTNSECKRIANNYYKTGKVSTISAALAGKNPFVSAALVAYGSNMNEASKLFQTAVDKGTGLKISYDYYISNTSYSLNKAKNTKIKYC